MAGIALGLGLPADYFARALHRRSADPVPHFQLPEPAGPARRRRAHGASASTPTTAC